MSCTDSSLVPIYDGNLSSSCEPHRVL